MDKQNFDFEAFKKQAASRLKKGDTLLGKDGVLTPLLKEFLEGELEAHIEDEGEANRKNGKGRKQVKTPIGAVFSTIRTYAGLCIPPTLSKASTDRGLSH